MTNKRDWVTVYDPRSPYHRKEPTKKSLRFSVQDSIDESLEDYRIEFETGDKSAVMRAIKLSLKYRMLPPEWASAGFTAACQKIDNFESNSWDEILGTPFPKGTHLNAIKKKHRLMHSVWLFVRLEYHQGSKLDNNGIPQPISIDVELFARAGKKFGIGQTLASEYYYSFEEIYQSACN